MNKLITSTAVPTRELKLEAIANISASFELLCLASGMEALGEITNTMRKRSVVHATHAVLSGGRTAGESKGQDRLPRRQYRDRATKASQV